MQSFSLACTITWDDNALNGVEFDHEKLVTHLNDTHIQTLVAVTLFEAGAEASDAIECAVMFVENARIGDLNREFRTIDEATDVLSFPMDSLVEELPPGMPRELGDIIIAPKYVEQQMATGTTMLPHGPGQEHGDCYLTEALERCIVHGALHLCGFDHEKGEIAAKEMFELEQLILERVRARMS